VNPARNPALELRRGRQGLSILFLLPGVVLAALVYFVVEHAVRDPAPALVVTCVIASWAASLASARPQPGH
jgi:hypothetical protein